MMCSSFVRSLAAIAAAAAAICATAFPDLGQNADWSAKNERGEGEGTSAEGGREGGSEGEEEAEHRYFRVVAAVLAESSAREGGREGGSGSVGRWVDQWESGRGPRKRRRRPRSKPKQATNFMRNCSVRNFSGWGSRRWEGRGTDRQAGHMEREWMPPLPAPPTAKVFRRHSNQLLVESHSRVGRTTGSTNMPTAVTLTLVEADENVIEWLKERLRR